MIDVGVIGRITAVISGDVTIALDLGSTGLTKVGPDGISTVGVVNSYITIPTGAHRVVGIVTGVRISRREEVAPNAAFLRVADEGQYELTATVVGRFEGKRFKSGLTGYPPLHAPVKVATPEEVKSIFIPLDVPALEIGTSAVATEQSVNLDANLLLGHHCAVVGSTGSGKSCTVTALIDALLDHDIPNGHIIIFDINGEYAESFAPTTPRGKATRTTVLGPEMGPSEGLFLPHWFMNNEEHLSLFRASEGVQTPVLQRAIADARVASSSTDSEAIPLRAVSDTVTVIGVFFTEKNAQQPVGAQFNSLVSHLEAQSERPSAITDRWKRMYAAAAAAWTEAALQNVQWQPLTTIQRQVIGDLLEILRSEVRGALSDLGLGSTSAASDFDAPAFYDLQRLCDFFLPQRIRMEQEKDTKIVGYVATLQMRLSRLLADGRYDFMTRVEEHADPIGTYLRLLMGSDPTKGQGKDSDWPSAERILNQRELQGTGPSVTIFDLSLVASDVLENVTSLLGRLIFEFAVRSNPRAAHPIMLVLEEAHRFVPARQDSAGSRSTAVFERIAKEGRKFGVSLLLASQRPSELSETIVAQCGTVIAHRLTHEADQSLLRHATALSSRALLDQLPGLAQQHALITGVSTGVPVAVRIRNVENPPKSKDPEFIQTWKNTELLESLEPHIDRISSAWQNQSLDALKPSADPATPKSTSGHIEEPPF